MENKSRNKSGYSRPSHFDNRRLMLEALGKHEKGRLGRRTDNRCEKVVLSLSEEVHERIKRNVYTAFFEFMEQAAVKAFLAGGAE